MKPDRKHQVKEVERGKAARTREAEAARHLALAAQRQLAAILNDVLGVPFRLSLATADGVIYVLREREKGVEFEPVFVPEGTVEGLFRLPLNVMYQDSKGRMEEITVIGHLGHWG